MAELADALDLGSSGETRGGSSPLARIFLVIFFGSKPKNFPSFSLCPNISPDRTKIHMTGWSPKSWQHKRALQQPTYPDKNHLDQVVGQLAELPPLVSSWEIETLKTQLAEAAAGDRFLLQRGDCAERFRDCQPEVIAAKLKVLLQMSLVLVHGTKRRVIRVGRFAGQYAKPRSSDTETKDGITLPAYRGDIINEHAFEQNARTPNPDLLLRGFERAALTLNFIRALIDGGFASLHHPEYWDLDFVEHSSQGTEYQHVVESIGESLRFMETLCGVPISDMNRVDFFTSHEALHLSYEEALTRTVPRREGWYDLSTHFPWLGLRTSQLDGAHIEFLRGIRNPLAIKVGPNMALDEIHPYIEALFNVLHPDNEPGRITIIHRYGIDQVSEYLPVLIDAVQKTGKSVLYCCDPMHGNTQISSGGLKTRRFDHILEEVDRAFELHSAGGSRLGGVHVELTGDNVTECTGGARGLQDADLTQAYKTQVDPRLNYEQAFELALLVARRASQDNV